MKLHLSYNEYKAMCEKEGWEPDNPASEVFLALAKRQSKLMQACNDVRQRSGSSNKLERHYRSCDNKRIKNMYLALEMAEHFSELEDKKPGFHRHAYKLKEQINKQIINERTLHGIYDFRESGGERQTTIH